MEKIKITVEQKEALSEYIDCFSVAENLGAFIRNRVGYTEDNMFHPLKNFTAEQFALLLCGWYEVKKPFKVGDWVFDRELGDYSKIIEIHADKIIFQGEDEDYIENFGDYEVITESWKITLLELGREKPELKIGDKFETIDGVSHKVARYPEVALKFFEDNTVKYFYPVEYRIEVNNND